MEKTKRKNKDTCLRDHNDMESAAENIQQNQSHPNKHQRYANRKPNDKRNK